VSDFQLKRFVAVRRLDEFVNGNLYCVYALAEMVVTKSTQAEYRVAYRPAASPFFRWLPDDQGPPPLALRHPGNESTAIEAFNSFGLPRETAHGPDIQEGRRLSETFQGSSDLSRHYPGVVQAFHGEDAVLGKPSVGAPLHVYRNSWFEGVEGRVSMTSPLGQQAAPDALTNIVCRHDIPGQEGRGWGLLRTVLASEAAEELARVDMDLQASGWWINRSLYVPPIPRLNISMVRGRFA
jgi:hypothetical protein